MTWKVERPCVECGELFLPFARDTKYCSKKCRLASNYRRKKEIGIVPRICPTCGTSFHPTGKKKYCKPECRPPKKVVLDHCVHCGKEFVKKTPQHKFCSNRCGYLSRYRNPLPPQKCIVCGEEYFPRVTYQKYCGRRCRLDDHQARAKRD